MRTFRDHWIGHGPSTAWLAGILSVAILPTGVFAQGFDQDPLFKDMTDVAKALVNETTTRFSGDYRGLCRHDTAKLTAEVSTSSKSLLAKGQLSAPPGFYELEAVNFFTKKCRVTR